MGSPLVSPYWLFGAPAVKALNVLVGLTGLHWMYLESSRDVLAIYQSPPIWQGGLEIAEFISLLCAGLHHSLGRHPFGATDMALHLGCYSGRTTKREALPMHCHLWENKWIGVERHRWGGSVRVRCCAQRCSPGLA